MKLLADFFPVLLFFVAYKLGDIYLATAVAIAASALQVGYHWLRRRRVESMHLVTLGILVLFGGLTILLQDRTFIMWKPSIVNWLFAAVFLGSHFIGDRTLVERMMSHAIEVPASIWSRLNQMWVLFFLAMGAANLYVANGFFVVDARLRAVTGQADVDLKQCAAQFRDQVLALCSQAHNLEEHWVSFKLFGMMGLTVLFVIGQAFYLARHVRDREAEQGA
jgi:intracellular septation protein